MTVFNILLTRFFIN